MGTWLAKRFTDDEANRVTYVQFVRHTSLPDLATGQCEPTDVRELYDHVKDPFELQNLLPAPPDSPTEQLESRLSTLTDQLHVCAGIEGRDPEPASGQYCR